MSDPTPIVENVLDAYDAGYFKGYPGRRYCFRPLAASLDEHLEQPDATHAIVHLCDDGTMLRFFVRADGDNTFEIVSQLNRSPVGDKVLADMITQLADTGVGHWRESYLRLAPAKGGLH